MNSMIHQVIHCRVDHAVAFQRQLTSEGRTDDPHMEMALALASVPGVLVALVQHFQLARRQRFLQAFADLVDYRDGGIVHGNTLRNGLTEVSR